MALPFQWAPNASATMVKGSEPRFRMVVDPPLFYAIGDNEAGALLLVEHVGDPGGRAVTRRPVVCLSR